MEHLQKTCPKCGKKMIRKDSFVLTDYKTGASFKTAQWLGIGTKDVPTLKNGEEQYYGPKAQKAGQLKTHKEIFQDPTRIEIKAETLQINRYRIFFEYYNFPISQMRIQTMPRDGGTYIAKQRGIMENLYLIPISRLPDSEVLEYYAQLQKEVDEAFRTGWARKCDSWESWGFRRCEGYCEISGPCKAMDQEFQKREKE